MSAGLIAGAVGLGILALAWMSEKEKTDNKAKAKKKKQTKEEKAAGYPAVPELVPDPKMTLRVTSGLVQQPAAWEVAGKFASNPNEALYVAALCDMLWLYLDDIEEDAIALGAALEKKGMTALPGVVAQSVKGQFIGEATVEFDAGLPDTFRMLTFWRISAQQWAELDASLATDFDSYPKFKASVEAIRNGTGIRPIGSKNPPKPGPGGATSNNPLTWGLPNTDGPAVVQTPHGPLSIPKGGFIEGGRPYYIVASGDTGAAISAKWGKGPAWAAAVAHENPEETFGGQTNTVYPGDRLAMPVLFLDPTYKGNPPAGSTGSGGGGYVPFDDDDDEDGDDGVPFGPPAPPSAPAAPGFEWVWTPDGTGNPGGGSWSQQPVQGGGSPPSPPPPDNGGGGEYGGAPGTPTPGHGSGKGGAPDSEEDDDEDGGDGGGGYGGYKGYGGPLLSV